MAASLGILVIRSSLVDWRSMKKECRHARHRKLSSISRFEHEAQKKVASLPSLGLDSRSRFSDLSFHLQLWPQHIWLTAIGQKKASSLTHWPSLGTERRAQVRFLFSTLKQPKPWTKPQVKPRSSWAYCAVFLKIIWPLDPSWVLFDPETGKCGAGQTPIPILV